MKHMALMLSALTLIIPVAAHAGGGTLTIPKKIAFDKKDTHVPDSVQRECDLEFQSSDMIRDAVKGSFDKVVQADHVSSKTPGMALNASITGLLAPGGGPFSGPKSVTITGTLWNNGKEVGSFKDERHTTRGHGTCGMLLRDAKEISEDIAKWLKDPKPDSRLGDAK